MSRRERVVVGVLTAIGALVPMDVFAQGCAMCATYLNGAKDPLTNGFKWSILLLLSVPYALFVSIGAWLGIAYWRSRRAPEPSHVVPFSTVEKEGVQ